MKLGFLTVNPSLPTCSSSTLAQFRGIARIHRISYPNWNLSTCYSNPTTAISLNSQFKFKPKPFRLSSVCSCSSKSPDSSSESSKTTRQLEEAAVAGNHSESDNQWKTEVGSPTVQPSSFIVPAGRVNLSDQAFYLLAFIACTTSVAFTSLVIAAVPTLYAMGRAAISLSKLADTAREELPSTMAAIRLSGMEISDLTLELSDLSHEIADGVSKSAQAVQAAEAGVRQIGSLAHHQTMSMIQERANLPVISLQPVVAGAAKKTSRAVGQARKTFMSIISRGEFSSDNEGDNSMDRLEV